MHSSIFFDGVLRPGVMVSVDGPGVRNSDNYAFGLGGVVVMMLDTADWMMVERALPHA